MQIIVAFWMALPYNSSPVVAGWSSLAARRAHNPKVVGSNPAPATSFLDPIFGVFCFMGLGFWCVNEWIGVINQNCSASSDGLGL